MAPGADRPAAGGHVSEGVAERLDGIAAWINDLDTRVRAAELATGDESTAKELRRAVETLSKHDPKLEKRLTNRVDVLADRLATLASTVSTTAASLARKDGEIASLRKELEEGNKRVEALVREYAKSAGADEVEKLRAAVKAVQAERPARSTGSQVDGLGRKVDYLTERVDTLAKTVATTAAGLAGREGELATLRQRLDEGSAHIERTAAELRRVQGDGTLGLRLDALKTAVDATTAGLAAREGEVSAVRARIDEAYSRVGTVVTDLQSSIATLSAQVGALESLPASTEQALDARAAEVNGRVDTLAERLASLATNVESAVSGLADKELEIGTLHRQVDEASERVDTVVAELRRALEQLPAPGTVDPEVEARLAQLAGSVAAVTSQLAALETASSAQAEGATARAAALERLLGEAGTRLDAVERDRDAAAAQLETTNAAWSEGREWVRARIDELAAADADALKANEGLGRLLEELAARLDSMESEHLAATAEIARVATALDAERESLHAQLDRLSAALDAATAASGEASEQALGELATRLQGLENDGAAVASEIARVATALDAERESLHAQLHDLAATVAETTSSSSGEDSGRMLNDLATRLASLEENGAVVASEVARTAAHWASELEGIETRLEQVTGMPREAATGAHPETERVLAELATRLVGMERDRQAVASEIARASQEWQVERSALEARLDEVATHLAEVESDTRGAAPTSSGDEVAQLRVAVDGLRMRLASSEQELATLVGARDTGTRIDELTRRLESLERAPVVIAGSADGGPLPGDGRFRLELRALELRMEHAELAARENREAVLVQLERLAARIEWRFQRLEAEYEASHPQAIGGGGQVVPIRPAEA